VIPEANLGSDLQAKIPDRVTGPAAFIAVVGSAHRTGIKLHTGPAYVSIEDRMEGTAGSVVAAQYAMVCGFMALRALSHQTLSIKLKEVSSHRVVREPAAVDRCDKFNVLFFYLQR
jgi:hypothetical protein